MQLRLDCTLVKVCLFISLHVFCLNMHLMHVKQNSTPKYIQLDKAYVLYHNYILILKYDDCFTAFVFIPWQTVYTDTSHKCAR